MSQVLAFLAGLITGICIAATATAGRVGDMQNELQRLAGGRVGGPASMASGQAGNGANPGPSVIDYRRTGV